MERFRIGILFALMVPVSVSAWGLAYHGMRTEQAAGALDAAAGFRATEGVASAVSAQWFATADHLLEMPLDVRGLELRAQRNLLQETPEANRLAARDLDQALRLAPLRPELHMRISLLAARDPAAGGDVGARLLAWQAVAPFHPPTQPWRLQVAASAWDRLSPDQRASLLDDVDVLCRRWGKDEVTRLAAVGQGAARLAVAIRLANPDNQC
jgi:hypothetical protein